MPSDHQAQVAELMADYQRSRERLAETHRELAAIAETASSGDGRVQVAVGARGELREVLLANDVCDKLRPAQLAATIAELSAKAAQAAARRAADVLAAVLPADTDPELLLGGHADGESESVLRNESRPIDDDVAEEEDFSEASWLQHSPTKRT
ncbi:YbaB/EbfC family nucleoid-associated protein [Saccharopolyspora sp. WRP15-2]|uniref:YbaB/EbfC family nucleoid-associated protein n=1 Tax=Saccharopolyspora oryzae TaxID=2997343 RepID=A0ABT4VB26_9PSEU|nr:YbaB/EbfC family nucleoid-associated protein [Saccharopolyspora oryzae]MDA3631167.1 YbaB/EbfC family nucleoid-associated protein [Saccharopolyspora oryzae]